MNEIIKVIILGIVEGITEFIPISSTGHLIIVGKIIDFVGKFAESFEVIIQLGAILAVVVLYHKKFIGLFNFKKKGFYGFNAILLLFLTTLPALIFGALFHGIIKTYLFSPLTVSITLIVGGIGMILAEKYSKKNKENFNSINKKDAFIIGLFQVIALIPGMSRSACTISGGLLLKFKRKLAAEYSFLAAVPVMIAATCYDLYKNSEIIFQKDNFTLLIIGFIISFIVAIFAIKGFITLLKKVSLKGFALYRIVLGIIILVLIFIGYF